MQQSLKPASGATRARIVATELLEKLFLPVHNAVSAFDAGFGRQTPLTLARRLETRTGRGAWLCASRHTSVENAPMKGGGLYPAAYGLDELLAAAAVTLAV